MKGGGTGKRKSAATEGDVVDFEHNGLLRPGSRRDTDAGRVQNEICEDFAPPQGKERDLRGLCVKGVSGWLGDRPGALSFRTTGFGRDQPASQQVQKHTPVWYASCTECHPPTLERPPVV